MAASFEHMMSDAETDVTSGHNSARGKEFPRSARSLLISMIEGEIIPRLFLAHHDRKTERALRGDDAIFNNSDAVAKLFLTSDSADIVARLQALSNTGVTREQIYLELLAPVARTLSIFWEEGRCSLDDVARGLSCVGQVLQEMQLRDKQAIETH
jgi:hypothetical protein